MTQAVTSLVIDARGAEVGSAVYVKAMRTAQAAVDRTIDAHNRIQKAQERGTAVMTGQAGSISGRSRSGANREAANSYDRLRHGRSMTG